PEATVVEVGERLIERALARAALVEAEIADRAEQPRPQRQIGDALLVVLLRERAVGAEERVLHDLLRVERILQDAMRVIEQGRLEPVDQPLEGAGLTSVNRQRQVLLRRRHGLGFSAGPGVL